MGRENDWEEVEYEVIDDKERERRKIYSRRRIGALVILLFLVFGVPVAGVIFSAGFSVVTAIFAGLLGIFGGLIGLAAGGIALAIGLMAAGVSLIVSGAMNMTSPALGTMVIGGGFFALAGAFLVAAVTKWCCGTIIPGAFRFCIDIMKKSGSWVIRTVRKVLGRGGAAE